MVVLVHEPPADDPVVGKVGEELGDLHLGVVASFGRSAAYPAGHGPSIRER